MDLKSTVLRAPGSDPVAELYDVRSKRVPFDIAGSPLGKAAVDSLMLREKAERREKFRQRGAFAAEAEGERLAGESGVWRVLDFTGKYHRALIDEEPDRTVPGHGLVWEDERPSEFSRARELEDAFAAIASKHEADLQADLRRQI